MANKLESLFRLAQFGAKKLGPGKVDDILAWLSGEWAAKGIPAKAIEKLEKAGKKALTSSTADLAKGINAFAGGAENASFMRETLGLARASYAGLKPQLSKGSFHELLQAAEAAGADPRVIEGIRKVGLDKIREIGVAQPMSAYARRKDPFIIDMYRKITKKAPPKVGAEIETLLKQGSDELPEAAAGAAALKAANALGFTRGERLAAGAARTFGGETGLGTAVQVGLPGLLFGGQIASGIGAKGRAQDLAVQGFQALGGTTSSAVLAEIVKQQETASRRQMVLQTYEPQLFTRVLDALSQTGGGPSSLTTSEREIGRASQTPLPARRPDNDVKFLLDQLLNESSGQF